MFLNYNRSPRANMASELFLALALGLGASFPIALHATDFQMPPSVAQAEESSAKSAKSLVSKGTYKLLVDAQKSIDKGRIDEAFEKLNHIIIRVQDNPYETAVVLKTAGYLYLQREQNTEAIELLKIALGLNALVAQNQQKLRYDLAQLSMADENYGAAIRYLKQWLAKADAEDGKSAALVRLGNAYLQQENYREAAKALEQAAQEKLANNQSPSEHHLQLLLACYVLTDAHNKAIPVLRQLMVLAPEKAQYPLRLVAVYDELEQPKQALASLEYAYKQGLLTETTQLSNLGYRLINQGYPYKAAQVLEAGLKSFVLWINPENLKLLAQAHIDSGRPDLAIPYLEKAILTTDSPVPGQVLSQLYLSEERYLDAAKALKAALAHAKGKQVPQLKLALAHSYVQGAQSEQALAVFNDLLASVNLDDKTRRQVTQWQAYLSEH